MLAFVTPLHILDPGKNTSGGLKEGKGVNKFIKIMFVIWCSFFLVGFVEASYGGTAVSMAHRLNHEEIPTDFEGWQLWYQQDQSYIKRTFGFKRSGDIRILRQALEELRRRPDYVDAPDGFRVFAPETSGQMQLLAAGIAARSPGFSNVSWMSLYGLSLAPEPPDMHPDLDEAVEIIRDLPLNAEALKGFEVYLLPYSMGDTGGIGGNGYTFIAAPLEGVLMVPHYLEVTLVHEIGHHLHFRYMPRTNSAGLQRWDEYLRLRDIPWKGAGEAMTESWAESSEEVFSEDFRVWVGSSRQKYFGDLAYPEPSPWTGEKLREFFLSLSEFKPTDSEDPWMTRSQSNHNH